MADQTLLPLHDKPQPSDRRSQRTHDDDSVERRSSSGSFRRIASQLLHLSEESRVVTEPYGKDHSEASEDTIYDFEAARRFSYESSSSEFPCAYALAEPLLNPEASSHRVDTADAQVETGISYSRPEFLFLRVHKETPTQKVGLFFRRAETGGVIISRIVETGLMAHSNLQVGDRIMSINNHSCLLASPSRVAEIIAQSESTLDIMVRNKDGCPHTISTCSQIPKGADRVGVTLKLRSGAIRVSRIHDNSLFHNTSLQPSHRALWINGTHCEHLGLQDAAELLIRTKTGFCTIISQPHAGNALVLACESHRTVWSSMAVGLGVVVGAVSAARSMG